MLTQRFALPEMDAVDVDQNDRLERHARVLRSKPLLQHVFRECHERFMELDLALFGATPGVRIELGAGVSPVRETFSDVLATDVVAGDGLDRVLDAENMDLEDNSVRALYGQNCFHHFPDPRAFFREAERVVAPGGGVLLIEPHDGAFASLIYPRLFATEIFDKHQRDWELPAAAGPMTGANQALSYIVFQRDRAIFEREFPGLELVLIRPMTNALRYLLSGGLNFRQIAPTRSEPVLKGLEKLGSPIASAWAIHRIIALRRRVS